MTGEKKTILLVDDDKDLVKSMKAFLEARGYLVDGVFNGSEAQARLDRELPDLIVLDVMMDYDAEGFNLAYKLNTEERTRRIPIVLVSGFEDQLDRKLKSFEFIQGRDWPAAKYFTKPVNLADLAKSIGNLLRETDARKAAAEV